MACDVVARSRAQRPVSRGYSLLSRCVALALSLLWLASAEPARAVPVVVNYTDEAGTGFDAPDLGPARKAAFEYAVNLWAQTLAGGVPIVVDAAMPPLGGTGSSALLGSTKAVTVHRNFPGAPQTDIWYGAALANEISGTDLNGDQVSEIDTMFNSDVDGPTILGSVAWYYGTDGEPGSDVDFVTIALHELGHGLGFFDLIDPSTGQWMDRDADIYSTFLVRPDVGRFAWMVDAERLAAITSGAVFWQGANVVAMLGREPPLYAPDPFQSGSSISHWDPSLPHQLMAPFYTEPNHDPGLLLPALVDMGWQLTVPTTPPVIARTPEATATRTLTPTPTPSFSPRTSEEIYVTNFDAGTVSVIRRAANAVTATIGVDDGPLGVAVAPGGRSVYVTNFRAGTLSVIDTRTHRVADTIWIGAACNGVAVTPDGGSVYVTTSWPDALLAIDTRTDTIAATIPVGEQPADVAITPDGRLALVTNFGSDTLSVVDTRWNIVRGTIGIGYTDAGALQIAIAPSGTVAYVSGLLSGAVFPVMLDQLSTYPSVFPTRDGLVPRGVAVAPDQGRIYVAGDDQRYNCGIVAVLTDATSYSADRVAVGDTPSGLAVTADSSLVYVANTGSDTVSVIKAVGEYVIATVPVGEAPMNVAIAQVPVVCVGDCNGDQRVTISELLTGVNIALGNQPLTACPSFDRDGDGAVTVDELLAATDNALNGCPD